MTGLFFHFTVKQYHFSFIYFCDTILQLKRVIQHKQLKTWLA